MGKRKVENYRGYQLVAAAKATTCVGKAWKSSAVVFEATGACLVDVIDQLRAGVDQVLAERARGSPTPTVAKYAEALRCILPGLSGGHLAMLKAHYHAAHRSLTATELAVAAKYASYRAVNLQYGEVGKRLWEELPTPLPLGKDGRPIFTFALAEAQDRSLPEDEWVWKMRPEVAGAMEMIGLHN